MKKCVITIGRQFGSGGGEIARKTAEKLQITCLDKELIEKSAEKSGISREAFESVDERATNSFLYSLAMSSYGGQLSAVGNTDIVLSDRLFSVQSEIIRKAAQESSCIIIGRCADDILSKTEKILRVFIYAPLDVRVSRIALQHDISEANAKTLIKKTDKKRASYYNFYTSKNWGSIDNYDLSIDSSVLGVDDTAELLCKFAEMKFAVK